MSASDNDTGRTLDSELAVGRKETNQRDLAMVYMNRMGPATVDELIVYHDAVMGRTPSRAYIYQVLCYLRRRGLVARVELESEVVVRHMLTADGERLVRDRELKFIPPHPIRPDFGDD